MLFEAFPSIIKKGAQMATNPQSESSAQVEEKTQVPRKYAVIFHNDDYTPMEFVMQVLVLLFQKTIPQATLITEEVHLKGKAVVAIYPKNIAQMRVAQVTEAAKANEFPLKCTMEAQ